MSPFAQSKKNVTSTWLLMAMFFVFVISIGWLFSYIFESRIILYIAVIFSLVGNFFSYFYSDKIALKVSGAKKADPKNQEYQRAIKAVENMSLAANMKKPDVYIIEDEAMNAFATGRNEEHSAVAFTTGLIKSLDKLELEGVTAHELAHIKNKDIFFMTIVVTLVGMISILSDILLHGLLFSGSDDNKNPFLLILGIVLIILSPIIAKIIQLAVSRKREFLADSTGAEITRHPEGLADALRKISAQNLNVKRVSTATSHLFIASPFSSNKKRKDGLKNLFSTHPPVEERIAALEKMG